MAACSDTRPWKRCRGSTDTPAFLLLPAGGNASAAAAALRGGLPTPKAVSFWLYNMLAQPLGADQLLLRESVPTQLSSVTNSSAYDLRFNLQGGSRSSQVRRCL